MNGLARTSRSQRKVNSMEGIYILVLVNIKTKESLGVEFCDSLEDLNSKERMFLQDFGSDYVALTSCDIPQPKESETVQAKPNQTIEHPCVITDEACGLCMTGEGECLKESKSHPNTLAGFLGGCAGDRVTPTQQMIFDAGVSSGMQRQKVSQPTKCVEFIQHQVIGGATFNALASDAQDWIMGACENYDNKTAQASLDRKEGE